MSMMNKISMLKNKIEETIYTTELIKLQHKLIEERKKLFPSIIISLE